MYLFVFGVSAVRIKGLRGFGILMAKSKKEVKPETATLTIRLLEEVLSLLRARAENENRSLSNIISTYLELVVNLSTSEVKELLSGNGRRRSKKPKKR